eukprot:s2246_g8.t1
MPEIVRLSSLQSSRWSETTDMPCSAHPWFLLTSSAAFLPTVVVLLGGRLQGWWLATSLRIQSTPEGVLLRFPSLPNIKEVALLRPCVPLALTDASQALRVHHCSALFTIVHRPRVPRVSLPTPLPHPAVYRGAPPVPPWPCCAEMQATRPTSKARPPVPSFTLAELKEATKTIASAGRQSHWSHAIGTLWQLQGQAVEVDGILYTAAVSACDRSQQWSMAFSLVSHVLSDGVRPFRPDGSLANEAQSLRVGFTAGLEACGRQHWTQALGLWRAMAALRANTDATAISAMVNALRPAAEWAQALGLLGAAMASAAADVALCNAVCTTCEAGQEWRQAVEVLRKMQDIASRWRHLPVADSVQALEPDLITFSAIISACEADGEWAFPLQTLQDMQRRKLTPNVITYNATIAACGAGGIWLHAVRLLKAMADTLCPPDVVSYNSVLASGLGWQTSLQLLQEMRSRKLVADALSYNSVMEAMARAWQWRAAVILLTEMQNLPTSPDAITISAAFSVCEKSGAQHQAWLLEEAAKVAGSFLVKKDAVAASCGAWMELGLPGEDANWDQLVSSNQIWPPLCVAVAIGENCARSPTHRTMLHVSSARLQHVQGIAYGFIEETTGVPTSVEAIFLCQLCAVFLDGRRIVDSNKLALAVRSLCVLILFCRRIVLEQLSAASKGDLGKSGGLS